MMKSLQSFILVSLLISTNNSFTQWTVLESPDFSLRHAIAVISDNIVYTVGSNGKFWKSTDSGDTWTVTTINSSSAFYGMSFINESIGYVCGFQGHIYKTTDGGETWIEQNSNTTQNLSDIHFVSANDGVAVGNGGVIRRTTNGGLNWMSVNSGVGVSLEALDLSSNGIGYTVGDGGTILKTSNFGASWNSLNSGTSLNLKDVKINTDQSVHVVGIQSLYLRSTNAGNSWVSSNIDMDNWTNLYVCGFDYSGKLWATGTNARIFGSIDSGNSWLIEEAPDYTPYTYHYHDIGFSENRLFITGSKTIRFAAVSSLTLDVVEAFEFHIFPNPFSEVFTIQLMQSTQSIGSAKVELLDMSGKVIQSQTAEIQTGAIMLNFDAWAIQPGVYMVRVLNENDRFAPIRVVKL